MMKSTVKFLGGMGFEADVQGHRLRMDLPPPNGKGEGPGPKILLLPAILGCAGMDIVSLLKKHRVAFDSFEMSAEAELTDSHPRIFQSVEVVFDLRGSAPDLESRAAEAARDSMTKYCGVSAMITKASPIFYTVRVNGEIAYRGQAQF